MMKVREVIWASCLSAPIALVLFAACTGEISDVDDGSSNDVRAANAGAGGSGTAGMGGGAGTRAIGGAGGGGVGGGSGGGAQLPGSSAGSGGGASAGEAGSGGGGTMPPTSPGGGGSTCDGFAVLAANCGTSGCHGAGSNLEDFAASEDAALDFVDKPGTLACGGQGLVIDTEDPAESLMVRKLSDDPPCGQQMPPGGSLSQDEIDCIEDWISGL